MAAALVVGLTLSMTIAPAAETGDPDAGWQLFGACSSCHSLAPGRHMTGPSLASIWGRRAGSIEGFVRYSQALRESDVIWDEEAMDPWLANPQAFIPGNRMTFPGMQNETQRRDLIAFLRSASEDGGQVTEGPSGGMTGQREMLDLKQLEANNRIAAISHCGDSYTVTAETGEAYQFWEFNLRIKTDGSDLGPPPGHPVVIPASMQGDRVFVIFASPAEISPFITKGC
ncbi:MAG: c-type cytochrome [Kiloniellales bacterium]